MRRLRTKIAAVAIEGAILVGSADVLVGSADVNVRRTTFRYSQHPTPRAMLFDDGEAAAALVARESSPVGLGGVGSIGHRP